MEHLEEILLSDRDVKITMTELGRFVVTAIPDIFNGGPVPEEWRAESDQLSEAVDMLFNTYNLLGDDFQWDKPETSDQ